MAAEFAAVTGFAANQQFTVVTFHSVLDDSQSEAEAALAARAPAIHAEKPLGQPGNMFFSNPFAVVPDDEVATFVIAAPGNLDLPVGRRVAHCVRHQIVQYGIDLAV